MNILLLHRDLRTKDNVALNEILKHGKDLYIFFIFNKIQIENNDLFSYHSFHFMVNALQQLNSKVKVNFFKANSELEVFEQMVKDGVKIEKIYWNKDFTPFALERSKKLKLFAQKHNIEAKTYNDYLLLDPDNPEDFISAKVFTPFWKKLIIRLRQKPPKIALNKKINALEYINRLSIDINELNLNKNRMFALSRAEVVNSINSIDKNYKEKRDMLFFDSTSKIAPAIKFGIVSIRDVVTIAYRRHKNLDNDYIRQLIWREFFYQCHIQSGRNALESNLLTRFDNFKWKQNKNFFDAWCNGKTGFEIVDAAMYQLNKTGYMNNRARMITASFLTKNLLIDWRLGERYFAQKLADYDPIVNNLSWQWVAGTGFDVNPFFRIFNPYLQQAKFDPDRIYIQKWLPKDYNAKTIIDYKESREYAIDLYRKTFSSK